MLRETFDVLEIPFSTFLGGDQGDNFFDFLVAPCMTLV